ncbi:glycerate kinase [Chloroflexi bacterium TSY]|nr:glycerate kinase [Chloroflexi bacterium TSY]
MPFERTVLRPNPTVRQPILEILEAALAAVDPYKAVQAALQVEDNWLTVGENTYDLDQFERIYVIGAGKAGTPMSQAVETALGDRITQGLVVVKHEHIGPTRIVEIVEASHPMPDELGVEAGRNVLAMADKATENDLVITLLSGGGSALLVAPAPGLTLDDLQVMTDALLACGATINEMNCLRKHCSAVKGGLLAQVANPATLLTLVLSDVVGNPLDVIASGPTVPDASTWREAWTIIEKHDLVEQLPLAIIGRIQPGLHGRIPETPKSGAEAFSRSQIEIIADNRIAAEAACQKAEILGYNTMLLTTYLEGEAREVAKVVVALACEIREAGRPMTVPACLVLGGETTVQLGEERGRGGRNQELALAAAIALGDLDGVTIASLATDGTDGPTDSAGGLVDCGTVQRGRLEGLRAANHLAAHDAYPFLHATNDLLMSGPTQTNVNDLIFVFVT